MNFYKKLLRKINKILYRDQHEYIYRGDAYLYIISFFEKHKNELNKKINHIMKYNENDLGFLYKDNEGNSEVGLPGRTKNQKTGYYKYMLGRYMYPISYVKNLRVLDAGCGLGWGSYLISEYPSEILSIDVNKKVITFAKEKWNEKKIDFRHYSVLELDSLNKKFDVILCFEVIEHLILNDGKLLLKQAFDSLSEKGLLILSSSFPDLEATAKIVVRKNIFHLKIYTKKELEKFAKEAGFQSVMFIGNTIAVIKK